MSDDIPNVTPPEPITTESSDSATPVPVAETSAAPAAPPPAESSEAPESGSKDSEAKPRRRGGGRKRTEFPNWVPTQYGNKKDDPFTSYTASVNSAEGVIIFTATDSKGDHTYKVKCSSISSN